MTLEGQLVLEKRAAGTRDRQVVDRSEFDCQFVTDIVSLASGPGSSTNPMLMISAELYEHAKPHSRTLTAENEAS